MLDLIGAYENYLTKVKQASGNTICSYMRDVRQFAGWLHEEEEAEIGFLGALGNKDGAIIDIGGASTEIVVKEKGKIVYKKSVDIGVVRLKDACGRDKQALTTRALLEVEKFGQVPTTLPFYGIGGTATTLAAQYLGLETYQSDKITGAKLPAQAVTALADKFATMSVEEIAKLPCMPKGREDVVLGGAVLLANLLKTLGLEQIFVSDQDNLEGYAIKRGLME